MAMAMELLLWVTTLHMRTSLFAQFCYGLRGWLLMTDGPGFALGTEADGIDFGTVANLGWTSYNGDNPVIFILPWAFF